MTLERLILDNHQALKENDTLRRQSLTMIIAQIKKAMIDNGIRSEPDEVFVDQQLTKYMKQLKETKAMIPADRAKDIEKCDAEIAIIAEYVPELITSPVEIMKILEATGIELILKNRGQIMKAIAANYKGKIDMKAVTDVLNRLMK